eukprot:Skav216935  [mRNA]  locus=scaffold546:154158:154589:+ [translate_table: standard]
MAFPAPGSCGAGRAASHMSHGHLLPATCHLHPPPPLGLASAAFFDEPFLNGSQRRSSPPAVVLQGPFPSPHAKAKVSIQKLLGDTADRSNQRYLGQPWRSSTRRCSGAVLHLRSSMPLRAIHLAVRKYSAEDPDARHLKNSLC